MCVYKATSHVFDIYGNYFIGTNILQIVFNLIAYSIVENFFVENVNEQSNPLRNKLNFTLVTKVLEKIPVYFYNKNLRIFPIFAPFLC